MRIRIQWHQPLSTELDLTAYEAEKFLQCVKNGNYTAFEAFIMDRARERTDLSMRSIQKVD